MPWKELPFKDYDRFDTAVLIFAYASLVAVIDLCICWYVCDPDSDTLRSR